MNPACDRPDAEDQRFLTAFESGALSPRDFHHREHLRLAWLCLTHCGPEAAMQEFPRRLRDFLARHRVDPTKYHETLAVACLRAVQHHVARTPGARSFADFIARHLRDDIGVHVKRIRRDARTLDALTAFTWLLPPDDPAQSAWSRHAETQHLRQFGGAPIPPLRLPLIAPAFSFP